MIRARSTDRRSRRAVTVVALVGLIGSLSATVAPVLARDPSPIIRPDHPAWDEPPLSATAAATASGPHQFIVRYRAGTAPVQRRLALAEPGVRHLRDVPGTNLGVVAVAGDTASTVAALQADPRIASVEVDGRSVRFADPHDETFWSEQWGMDNTGQSVANGDLAAGTPNVDIDLPEAFGVTEGSSDVVVAVIDDGVDFGHPDLAGHEWTNPGESGGGKETNGVDDDGNGYIDDVHGWDFCNDDNTVHDFDEDFHGTHVAGTIAASLDGNGVVGIAPGVHVMALKFIDGGPFCGRDSQAIAAIDYAKHFGVRLANASWGEYGNPTNHPSLKTAIATSGMLLVAAAGNDHVNNDAVSTPALPASFNLPNIISVAAIDNRGRLASFSNYGAKTVDIAAPGVDIISSLPADAEFADPGWGWLSGTSMAAPHVTGVAALVLSKAPDYATDIAGLRARILASGKSDSHTAGKTATARYVDAYRALDFTPPTGSPPSSVGFLRGSILGTSTVTAHVVWPSGTDDLTGVASYGVQVQANGGAWATATSSTTARTYDKGMHIGTSYAFRVRPRDAARNWGDFAEGAPVRPTLYQQTTSLSTYRGTWKTSSSSSWSSGSTRYASKAGASVTFQFTGSAVAVVAPKGPTRGSFKLYVDGVLLGTYSTHRSSTQARVVVAQKTWGTIGAHVIKLVVSGTSGHPRVDVDAFLVMR